jgi:signal peptidase
MRKAAKSFGFVFIILLMTSAAFTFLAPHFGWRVDAVFSGSMEPALKVGGVVITRPVAAREITAGDIITFYSPQTKELTSHRVIAVEDGPSVRFRTKGDANEDADPVMAPADSVVGRICFHIPYLGYVTQLVKTPLGLILALCLPGLIIIILEMRNIWRVLVDKEVRKRYG